MTNNLNPSPTAQASSLRRAWLYFYRSMQLKCPVCGLWPLFRPLSQVRSVQDWFETLPGCPHCNYIYDREPGYFLLAFWMFDYGAAALFGLVLFLFLSTFFQLSTLQLLLFTLIPIFIFAILIVRHSKALYLAMDHYFFRH